MGRRDGGILRELGIGRTLRVLSRSRGASSPTAPSAPSAQPAEAGLAAPAPPEPSLPPELLLEGSRANVASLLAEIERLRPGLARHRALEVNCGSGSLLQALCERFDECEGTSPRVTEVRAAQEANRHGARCRYLHLRQGQDFPFADETFDFVHCGTLLRGGDGAHARHLISEAIRVLRLLGVAVVDLAGDGDSRREPLPVGGTARRLDAHLSAPERLSVIPSGPARLSTIVTNTGMTVLGSVINPPRLEGHWNRRGGAATATEAELGVVLLPGEAVAVTLDVTAPATLGTHMLELSLASLDPWDERRSPATVVAIVVGSRAGRHQSPPAAVASGPDEPVSMAVAQAGGVILNALSVTPRPGALPRQRYFFARA